MEPVAVPSNPAQVAWREPSRFVGWTSLVAIVILLFAASNAGHWAESFAEGPLVLRAVWCLLYLAAFLHLVLWYGTDWLIWVTRHQTLLVLLLAWALLSTSWSLAPSETARKSLSLVGTTLLGVYIGYALRPSQLERVLRYSFAVVIVASLVAIPLLADSIVVEPLTGEWRGLMSHKNSFGAMAAFASLFFLAPVLRGERSRLGQVMCAVCLLALFVARSRTAIVSCAVGVSALTWGAVVYEGRHALPTGIFVLCLLGAMGVAGLTRQHSGDVDVRRSEPGHPQAPRDDITTLTGRTAMWQGALQIIGERPLTGYGYYVVWGRRQDTLLPHIPITAHRSASSAHNAILNTATELGLPAALLLAMYCLTVLLHALRFYKHGPSSFSLFVAALVMAVEIMSITETTMLQLHSVFWILFVATAVMLEHAATALRDGETPRTTAP